MNTDTELIARLDKLERENGGRDSSAEAWAVRACGIIMAMVANPERFSQEEIHQTMEILAAKAPDSLLAASTIQVLAIQADMANNN